MERNAVVAKMERAGQNSFPYLLKYSQIPAHCETEKERAAVTVLKGEKKGLLAYSKLCQRQGKLVGKDKRRADA